MLAIGLQAAGAALLAVGAALIFFPAGLMVAGVFALLFGVSIARSED